MVFSTLIAKNISIRNGRMLDEEWNFLLNEMNDENCIEENTFEWMPNKCFRQLKM